MVNDLPKPRNPWEGRWRWWYSSIADWMIANPDKHLKECASALGKHANTISAIAQTDLFKRYLEERKREYRERHDFALVTKVTKVASLSLDILAEQLETKRTAVPIRDIAAISSSALERLGYGVQQPAAAVQVNVNNNPPAISASALSEAREALRLAEERKRSEPPLIEHNPSEVQEDVPLPTKQ
jgi:hypothetical protein